jgi:hypothetical protein
MSYVEDAERRALQAVADGMRDALEEDGHRISAATRQHSSFKEDNRPRSVLARSMIRAAARRAASQAGGFHIDASGEQLTLIWLGSETHRKYRLKKARERGDGSLEFLVGHGSAMVQADVSSLWLEEPWVLGYTMLGDHIAQVFAAEIKGVQDGRMLSLILGDIIPLLGERPDATVGFVSDQEDELPGFEDEAESETDDGISPA